MTKILLLFAISALTEGKLYEYTKEIIATNQQRSLILVYNNRSAFDQVSQTFYNLSLPLYNIYLPELKKFNGKYNDGYEISVTYEEAKLYFFFFESVKDLVKHLPKIRRIYFWRDRDRVVVFLNGIYNFSELEAGFRFCYQFYIVNIVLAFVGDKIQAFSYNPFTGNYLLGMENPRELFPDKFRDLYGYRLRISMFPSVINLFTNGTYQGSDGLISRAIARHLNASYVYIHPRVSESAAVLNQYDDVARRIADVGFNTRYVKFNFKNLIEKTYPHDRDDLTCLIPKIGMKKFIGLNSLLSESVWILSFVVSLFFLFYMISFVLWEGKRFDFIDLLIMILMLLVNKPVRESPKLNFRLALTSYLVFSFFLNTLIVGRLTSIFTAPAHFQGIETLRELADTDYEIVTIDRFQELLNASLASDLHHKILPRLTLIEETDYLQEIKKCKNVVYILKNHLARYAQIQPENYPNGLQFYRIMKETILPTLSCYIVSYGSPFLNRIDTLVRRIVESGFYDYWKMKTWQQLDVHNDVGFTETSYGQDSAITLKDLWFSVKMVAFGLGTSVVIFLVELLSIKLFKCLLDFILYMRSRGTASTYETLLL